MHLEEVKSYHWAAGAYSCKNLVDETLPPTLKNPENLISDFVISCKLWL